MAKKQEKQTEILKALYRGKLPIGGVELDCAVLNDNTRILTTSSIFQAFKRGYSKGWYRIERKIKVENELKKYFPQYNLTQPPIFLDSLSLIPLINQDLFSLMQPIKYLDNKQEKEGYNANVLVELCNLYLEARRTGVLNHQQKHLAEQAEVLLASFAKVGIIALIDEATGFQYDRKHDALRILLEQYIADGLQKWVKKFPDEFFTQLDKLYKNEKTTSRTRPKYYGLFINKYIYEPIEHGYVKQELDKVNIKEDGKRKARFHQWLTEFGNGQLTLQIGRVMGVMEISTNIRTFKEKINRQKKLAIQPELFDIEEYNTEQG